MTTKIGLVVIDHVSFCRRVNMASTTAYEIMLAWFLTFLFDVALRCFNKNLYTTGAENSADAAAESGRKPAADARSTMCAPATPRKSGGSATPLPKAPVQARTPSEGLAAQRFDAETEKKDDHSLTPRKDKSRGPNRLLELVSVTSPRLDAHFLLSLRKLEYLSIRWQHDSLRFGFPYRTRDTIHGLRI